MKYLFPLLTGLLIAQCLYGQDKVYQTFKDRWVINSFSVETLPKRKLDVRIVHRFGDFAGDAGGWPTLYGIENAADVAVGAEFGVADDLTLGFGRSKGAGQLRQLLNFSAKYRLLSQYTGGRPVSLALLGMTSVSTAQKSEDPSSMNFFRIFPHRMVHHVSLLLARKFSPGFSLQLSGGVTHRNVAPSGEGNNFLHAGLATRIQLTKMLGFIADVAVPFIDDQNGSKRTHYAPVGVGLEFDTGGHVFQLNFTNTTGIMPTDYIPYTYTNWLDGQYRIGFTISRLFNL